MENLYTTNCIRTFTGKYIDPLNPDPELICIEDIAHALSMQPRFGGHLPKFYSVARHSIWCASMVEDKTQELAALLHDASEAYLIDVPKPIKYRLTNYEEIEDKLMSVIAKKFGIQFPFHHSVKSVDKFALEWEWEKLMLKRPASKFIFEDGLDKLTFLHYFNKLTGSKISTPEMFLPPKD